MSKEWEKGLKLGHEAVNKHRAIKRPKISIDQRYEVYEKECDAGIKLVGRFRGHKLTETQRAYRFAYTEDVIMNRQSYLRKKFGVFDKSGNFMYMLGDKEKGKNG